MRTDEIPDYLKLSSVAGFECEDAVMDLLKIETIIMNDEQFTLERIAYQELLNYIQAFMSDIMKVVEDTNELD